MFEHVNFYVVIIFILICIIAYLVITRVYIFDQLVNGFYESDSSFCQESEIDMFCIYIDDDVFNGERSCYILVKKDNEIIINEPCTVRLVLKSGSMLDTQPKYFTAEFKDLSDEVADVFARHQNLQYYPKTNKIILHDGLVVTCVAYKNGMNTEMKSVTTEND